MKLDEGYFFGLGCFETIYIRKQKPIFLDEHLDRLITSLEIFNIKSPSREKLHKKIGRYISKYFQQDGALKIIVSQENIILTKRNIFYKDSDYTRGFDVNVSKVIRNETSILTYHKTLNYGDNILEKRKSKALNYDEPLFLNTKGEICEGATTNIFFIKDKKLCTPKIECGLLNGVVRQYMMKNYDVIEQNIDVNEIENYNSVFMTNSLVGIVPVNSITFNDKKYIFNKENVVQYIKKYKEVLEND